MERQRLFFFFFILVVFFFFLLVDCRISAARTLPKEEISSEAREIYTRHSGELKALCSILPRGIVPPSGPGEEAKMNSRITDIAWNRASGSGVSSAHGYRSSKHRPGSWVVSRYSPWFRVRRSFEVRICPDEEQCARDLFKSERASSSRMKIDQTKKIA
ncbi:hypothetical protein M5K25_016170 [Dendrobium thyrsiflorum]|uniref:Uncharacterized protein n=1 Tax=Dendrobium thyrsiflorum TaxID=117978 RepID=A0ABD0UJ36_DENTH